MRSPPSGPATTGSGGGSSCRAQRRSASRSRPPVRRAGTGNRPTELIGIGPDPAFTDQDPAIKRRQHAGDLDAVVPKGCVCAAGNRSRRRVRGGRPARCRRRGECRHVGSHAAPRSSRCRPHGTRWRGRPGRPAEHDRRVSRSTGIDRSSARRSIAAAASRFRRSRRLELLQPSLNVRAARKTRSGRCQASWAGDEPNRWRCAPGDNDAQDAPTSASRASARAGRRRARDHRA